MSNAGASTSEPLDMAMKNTGVLLKRMRALLKNTNYVSDPLQAYIIPCTDAHQVLLYENILFFESMVMP